ncbi:hypothetical protein [Diaminobutyricibacter sp. McL0608]|uniref:hypothetical protein n=1 Tax=Leifsonia sp. McL0608 TaxID=3143537 RepID=UPI0031F2E129
MVTRPDDDRATHAARIALWVCVPVLIVVSPVAIYGGEILAVSGATAAGQALTIIGYVLLAMALIGMIVLIVTRKRT